MWFCNEFIHKLLLIQVICNIQCESFIEDHEEDIIAVFNKETKNAKEILCKDTISMNTFLMNCNILKIKILSDNTQKKFTAFIYELILPWPTVIIVLIF